MSPHHPGSRSQIQPKDNTIETQVSHRKLLQGNSRNAHQAHQLSTPVMSPDDWWPFPHWVPSLRPNHSHVRVLMQGSKLVLHPVREGRGWGGTGQLNPSPGFGEAQGSRDWRGHGDSLLVSSQDQGCLQASELAQLQSEQ